MVAISNRRFALIGALVFVVSIMGWVFTGCSGGSSDPDAGLTAQSEPSNGALLTGSSYGNAGVQVTTASGTSAYVKVKTMSGSTTAGFFVRSGSTASVRVPAGTYAVQFATGETWYGESDLFGSETSYSQDKSISLRDSDMIAYTLKRQSNGNFSPSPLDGSDF